MAYRLMQNLIEFNRQGKASAKSKVQLQDMADVYYGAGRLTDEQYTALCAEIAELNK